MWGIRNKNTNKFLTIGMLDKTNEVLYCDSEFIKLAKLWENKDIAEKCYKILSADKFFRENHFVDKLTEEERRKANDINSWAVLPYEAM